jgi:hypothetical protein
MATKELKCGRCGVEYVESTDVGYLCDEPECNGAVVEVVIQDTPKKRTRKTNPLRWARHLDEDKSPRKMVEAEPHLLDNPAIFGPEFATPTLAHAWLGTPGNTKPGYIHDLVRISERGIVVEEVRQLKLIQRTDDDAYVTISKVTL